MCSDNVTFAAAKKNEISFCTDKVTVAAPERLLVFAVAKLVDDL